MPQNTEFEAVARIAQDELDNSTRADGKIADRAYFGERVASRLAAAEIPGARPRATNPYPADTWIANAWETLHPDGSKYEEGSPS